MRRCKWVENSSSLMTAYHDTEWGVPVTNDKKLFEFIVLESAQAGLSWSTILNKREGYRKAFKDFDVKKVSRMTMKDVEKLLKDSSIVRNQKKIESAIQNATAFIGVQKEFGSFAKYMWEFVGGIPIQNRVKSHQDIPAATELSIDMAKDLKKRGFSFLGPTVWYAHMQAVGMVNDHTTDCFRYEQVLGLTPSY